MQDKTTKSQYAKEYRDRMKANGFIFQNIIIHASIADHYRQEIAARNKAIRAKQYLESDRQYCVNQIAKIL